MFSLFLEGKVETQSRISLPASISIPGREKRKTSSLLQGHKTSGGLSKERHCRNALGKCRCKPNKTLAFRTMLKCQVQDGGNSILPAEGLTTRGKTKENRSRIRRTTSHGMISVLRETVDKTFIFRSFQGTVRTRA